MAKNILVIEDERDIADLLKLHLTELGTKVTCASDGLRGLTLALQTSWNMVLLDISLPGCDGLAICRQLREEKPQLPIIMVTAKTTESDRVTGLDCGADDYITKPFGISELVARVKASFRRIEAWSTEDPDEDNAVFHIREIEVIPAQHSVTVDGQPVTLTAKEFDLLLHFLRSPDRVFKRVELLQQVWGYTHNGYLHTVNSHINRLRAKIEPDPANPRYITTVWGVGYRMSGA